MVTVMRHAIGSLDGVGFYVYKIALIVHNKARLVEDVLFAWYGLPIRNEFKKF